MSAAGVLEGVATARRRPLRAGLGNLWALAVADFLERTRRANFFVSLAFMAWIANGMLPASSAGYRTFQLGGYFRPAYGPGSVGVLVALLTGCYFVFVGFYLVKGAVDRDHRTGVGPILAASQVSRLRYVTAKTLSNLLVLSAMAAVALVVALLTQQLAGEDRSFDLLATALPFVVLTLPVALLVASAAVLFECLPGLRGALGNVAWFFVITVVMATSSLHPETNAAPPPDLMGLSTVTASAYDALRASHPELPISPRSLELGVNVEPKMRARTLDTFRWAGPRWTLALAASRLIWCAAALAMIALAAALFDRFDRRIAPARASRLAAVLGTQLDRLRNMERTSAVSPRELTSARVTFPFPTLVAAELRLALAGANWFWFAGFAGLTIAQLVSPSTLITAAWLPIASLWPVFVIGALGSRERRDGTAPLLFSAPRPIGRMLAAQWFAGVSLMLLVGAGGLLKLAASGDWHSATGWLLACALLPALALASGIWTGSSKLFEVLLLFAWYIGPMHHVAELDYTGVTTHRSPALWLIYGGLTLTLLVAALIGRRRQLRS